MKSNGNGPTLTDAKGLGGVIAQGGFDYQLWDGLARLPAWLANPAFEELIFEGLEDLEARFFAPQSSRNRLLERYQAKSGNLSPAQVREVLESFYAFEIAFPRLARVQTLVTPRLPSTLGWLGRDPGRVRKARPFYAPFEDVANASDEKLRLDIINQYGDVLGGFVADSVEFCERIIPDRDAALTVFGVALTRVFPRLNVSHAKIESAFDAISGLARHRLGTPIQRGELTNLIEESLDAKLFYNNAFPIHVRSDRNEEDETALEIDASLLSGDRNGFPAASEWAERLTSPLDLTARWLRSRSVARVELRGSYRLTTAFILGWSFRSAIGFDLEIPTRSGAWATDDHAGVGESFPELEIHSANMLVRDRLVVSIGVLRDPSPDVVVHADVPDSAVMRALLHVPVTSGSFAQACVATIKAAVSNAVTTLRPRQIDFYFAGPAAFAVALGHRWNGMPPTQLHEFVAKEGRYVLTAEI